VTTLTDLITAAVAALRADARWLHVLHQRADAPADREVLSAEVRRQLQLADELERAATSTGVHAMAMRQHQPGSPA
jgi:hypothetical protein